MMSNAQAALIAAAQMYDPRIQADVFKDAKDLKKWLDKQDAKDEAQKVTRWRSKQDAKRRAGADS